MPKYPAAAFGIVLLLSFTALLGGCRNPRQHGRLAVVTERGEILIADSTGSILFSIDGDEFPEKGAQQPIWSNDGTRLAFLDRSGQGVYIAAADGTWVREVYSGVREPPQAVGWSPDDHWLVMTTSADAAGAVLLHVLSTADAQLQTLDAGQNLKWAWDSAGLLTVSNGVGESQFAVEVGREARPIPLVEGGADSGGVGASGSRARPNAGAALNNRVVHDTLDLVVLAAHLSPDGRLLAQYVEGADGITLVIRNAKNGAVRRQFNFQPTPALRQLWQRSQHQSDAASPWTLDSRYLLSAEMDEGRSTIYRYPAYGLLPKKRLLSGVEVSISR